MTTWVAVRFEDATIPGIEGDVLQGGPVGSVYWQNGERIVFAQRHVCTSSFDQPRDTPLKIHGAHDYAPEAGGPRELTVLAENPGRVIWYLPWNGISGPDGHYGNVLILQHDDGELSFYAHLNEFAAAVREWISRGANAFDAPYLERNDAVGLMGNTGNVWPAPANQGDRETGKHLHFEVRSAVGGVLIDPLTRMKFMATLPNPAPPTKPALVNPTPNTPLNLGPIGALDEARLLYRLILDLDVHPLPGGDPYGAAIAVISREVREIIASYGTAPATPEALALVGMVELLATNPIGYSMLLAAVRRELAEIILILQGLVPV